MNNIKLIFIFFIHMNKYANPVNAPSTQIKNEPENNQHNLPSNMNIGPVTKENNNNQENKNYQNKKNTWFTRDGRVENPSSKREAEQLFEEHLSYLKRKKCNNKK